VTAFEEFAEASRKFWRAVFAGTEKADTALIEGSLDDEYLLHGILKVGLVFSRLNGLRPVVAPPVRRRSGLPLIRSMCPSLVPIRWLLLTQLVRRLPRLLRALASLRTGADAVTLEVDGAEIGPYIYDCVVGRFHVPTLDRLTWKMKLYAVFLLTYFFAFRTAVRAYRVKLVVLHDPAYLCGLLFQICKVERVKCINAINLTIFQMRRYLPTGDYTEHYRKVEPGVLARIPDEGPWRRALEDYMHRRLTGRVDHHDVLTAFSSDKVVLARAELERTYGLTPGRPLVVLMAHIFADAPHAFGGALFRDSYEWFVQSLRFLGQNGAINLLVKAHPSARLYGETGLVERIMASEGCGQRLLRDDVHTETILRCADCVVTRGGTIGLEFAVFGKPAVLGARPPYAGLGFTVEPADLAEYRTLLSSSIQDLPRLTERQALTAQKAAFVAFEMMDAYDDGLELGGMKYHVQREYDRDAFFRRVVAENSIPLESQRIFKALRAFEESSDPVVLNWSKLTPSVVDGGY
jgi:Capsule polysaccharide biosynthesis protein